MPDQLADLDQQIRQAWTDLQAARADWAHSPNADSIRHETTCEWRLNRLLERRYTAHVTEQIADA